ncbi:PAS domain-containing protein [Chondromyces crocatus]|nr:PAS domain-containing protein [Chondromyces crocatus]AKT41160.1 uncharacterized protein CMC5_053210 [Chondromyces crocatus]
MDHAEGDTAELIAQLRAENEALRTQLRRADAPPASSPDPRQVRTAIPLKSAEIRYDVQGRLTEWSRESERLLGWRRDEVVGRFFWEVITPEEVPPEIVQLTLQFTLTGQLVTARAPSRTRSGERLDCTWTNTVFRDAEGTPVEVSVEVLPVGEDSPAVLLRRSQAFVLALLNNSPSVIYVKDTPGRYLLVNQRFLDLFHFTEEQVLGKTDAELFPHAIATAFREADEASLARGEPLQLEELAPAMDGDRIFFSSKFPLRDGAGRVLGICGISTDITKTKRADEAREAMQEQMIQGQRAALRELSSPLMPIAEGVLAMPLVGTIDSLRAREILETLLDGIARERARTAIVDITGVKVMDTLVANALVGVARAARLLGAEVLLTGMSPAVAQTLVALQLDLTDLTTLSTLQSGIAHALRHLRRDGSDSLRR